MYPAHHLGPFTIYTFGLAMGAAFCLCGSTYARYFRLHHIAINNLAFQVTVLSCGLIGAILDSTIVSLARHHRPDAGLTYLGAVLAGGLSEVVFARICRIQLLPFFDSLFCIAPAYALGRIGCFLAGDGDYGIPTSLPWGVSFPHGVVPTIARVHPTMLYISLWEIITFVVLWRLSNPTRDSRLRPGTLLGLYLMATSTGRFAVEFLSLNPKLAWGLSEAQLVSVALWSGGLMLLLRLRFVPSVSMRYVQDARVHQLGSLQQPTE